MEHAASNKTSSGFILLWTKIPVIIRALVLGFLILMVGQWPVGLILINLQLTPAIPWFLPVVMIWLWLFWQYVNGSGWPKSTSEIRKQDLRANSISKRIWFWSLLAGAFGLTSVAGLIFVISRHADLPAEAYQAPFDVTPFPVWTKISIFLAIAITAGVVEEAVFRGYMLSQIQRRHGWLWSIMITGLMFYLVHLGHAYATIAFLPFFLIYSILHGFLVYITRSILPSVVLHSLGDSILLPMQYGVLKNIGEIPFVYNGWMSLIFALVAIPLFYYLSIIAEKEVTREGELQNVQGII